MLPAMAKAFDEWKVLPHGPIERLAENLWRVEGSLPRMSLKRVMTVARRADGRLVVHAAIALEESAIREIEAWGPPAFLLVPNGFHRLDARAYKKRYPDIRVLAPSGSRRKVEEVMPIDGTYDDFPPDEAVRLERLAGIRDAEGALIVRSADGVTVVLNDLVFNMDRKRDPLGFLFTTLLGSAPGPRISRLVRLLMVRDRPALRADLERLAATPGLTRLVVSHEKVASGAAASEALRQATSYL